MSGKNGSTATANESTSTENTGQVAARLSTVREAAEAASRLGFALLALCYVLGFLILNLHLAQYGIFTLSFLQIGYVIVGALWIVLVGFTYLVLISAGDALKSRYEEWKNGGASSAFLSGVLRVIAFVFGAFSVVLPIVGRDQLSLVIGSRIPATLVVLGILAMNSLMVGELGRGMVGAWSDVAGILLTGSPKTRRIATSPTVYNAAYQAAILLSFVSLYALYAFPKFSKALGGGQEQVVERVARANHLDALHAIGFKMLADGRTFGPLEVVHETDDALVVVPPREVDPAGKLKAIRLPKNLVEAVMYFDSTSSADEHASIADPDCLRATRSSRVRMSKIWPLL